jgi:perosamine synthetase
MLDIQLFKPKISDAAIQSVEETLKSGWIGLGPKVEQFEQDFCNYIGCKHAVGLNSATSGLHLAMILTGIEDGDEVITTPLTFVSTNHAILYQNAIPVFVDVEYDTLNIDATKIEEQITNKTKAIICVHYGGYPCDMDKIYDIASNYNLIVIEDCAHAMGAEYKGDKIGACSQIAVYSFHAVKNLPMGDGGMIAINDAELYEKLKKLRWMGINKDTYSRRTSMENLSLYSWQYNVEAVGYKYHMNDISAAIGIEQLKLLDLENQRREEIAQYYTQELSGIVELPQIFSNDRKSSYHIYHIKSEKRNYLHQQLKNRNIGTGVHYIPNHLYDMYESYYKNLPVTENVWKKILSLPMHLFLSDSNVERVVHEMKDILGD